MSLANLPNRHSGRVTGIRLDGPSGLRLMELGLIEGVEVEVVGRAPLGDPLRVRLGDCELSLRSADAELVDVD